MLPSWFKEYLSFHKSERRGIIALVIFLMGLIGFNMYQRFFWKGDWEEIHLKYGEQILRFEEENKSDQLAAESPKPWLPQKKSLFKFDPNTLDSAGWVALGFSPKQSAAILKYRTAGAVFRKPEDVKKLFVVDNEKYEELRHFIEIEAIPEKLTKKEFIEKKTFDKPKWEKPKYEAVFVELNSADSAQLVQVRGIGPFFAKVILEHREKLGGYRSKDQVLEVYGMDSTKFARIENQLTVDSIAITKIDINSATFKELLKHPYINYNQTKAIVNYREQHGSFKSIEDLQKIHLVKGETYRKIAPYLEVP